MANTYVDYTATAAQTDFAFTFDYLEDEHVTVEINGVAQISSDYSVIVESNGDTKVRLNVGATAGQNVRVRRKSQPDTNLVDFQNGSVLTESELDRAYLHNRYLAEEIAELNDQSLQIEAGGTQWDAKSLRLKNVATPTDTTDAVTKIYLDDKVNQVSSGATQPPLKWTFTGDAGANTTYTVTGSEVQGDTAYDVSIDGAVQEPTTDFTVDPDTDTLTIVPTLSGGEDIVIIQRGFGVAVTGTVGTNSLVDGSVTAAKISTTDTKFNVQSDGKVGIGTASPDAKLDVQGDLSVGADAASTSAGYVKLQGYRNATDQGVLGHIRFDNQNGGSTAGKIEVYAGGSTTTGTMRFHTTGSERMRIAADGKVGIGTASPNYELDVAGDVNVTGDFKVNGANLVPAGTVSAFAGSAAPTGYVLCDGSEYSEVGTYAALFAVLGSTYNTGGETANHFRVPDLRGRVVAGLDNMGGTSADRLTNPTSTTNSIDGDVLGDTGGHETHQLTTAEMPSHSHTIPIQQNAGGDTPRDGGTGTHVQTRSTGTTGGDQAHNNVQPTIILNYIIKI